MAASSWPKVEIGVGVGMTTSPVSSATARICGAKKRGRKTKEKAAIIRARRRSIFKNNYT
jgi:hypothetical protein